MSKVGEHSLFVRLFRSSLERRLLEVILSVSFGLGIDSLALRGRGHLLAKFVELGGEVSSVVNVSKIDVTCGVVLVLNVLASLIKCRHACPPVSMARMMGPV